jgi:C_GCAxxG_C_C family probable redox protein
MSTKDEMLNRVYALALESDRDYHGCSQSVLDSIQREFLIGNKEVLKSATVIAGGLLRQGETCGAIIGAMMALGLVIGRDRIEDSKTYRDAKAPCLEVYNRIKEELKREFGFEGELESTLCRDIQEKVYGRPFKMWDPDDYQAFLDAGGHSETGCPKICAVAARVAAESIMELIWKPSEMVR